MTREIPLSRGMVALVDDEDFDWLNQFKWCVQVTRGIAYAVRSVGGPHVRMHRLILNCPDDMQVDHVNRNSLDNRRANLRLCTPSQNMANRIVRHGTVPYRGVARPFKGSTRFFAYIKVGGKQRHLGTFATAEEAATAYDRAAREAFGSFAMLNFPEAA